MKRWRYQEIYFVHADSGIRSTVRKLRQLGIPDKQERLPFLYLGRDYFKCLRWEEALGRGWQRIRYGQLFQDIASEHQDAYLDWTARAGEKRDKLIWWSSRLAEKNTLLDSFYHQICYLMIASHFLNEQGSILIVAESDALLNQISSKVQANRKAVRLDSRSMFLRRLTLAGRILRSWAAYGARCLAAWRAARATRTKGASVPPIASGPTVVIHTWIDESYFAATGAPSDRYFTVLPDELTKRGFRVFVLPYLANISRSRREAFAWFRACDGRYIIPADFYGITDYIWSALKTIAQVRLAREVPLFQGIDLKLLAKEFCAKQLCDASLADFIAYYTLVRRWEKLGFRIDLFVDTFENMACEKPIVMAFREFMPETVTCGYVHYLVVADLELSIYTTSLETASGAPHPDVIVCSSPYTARSLSTQCGFPAKKIRVGPSLRYLHLAEVQDVEAVEPNSVLVILSLVGAASAELLEKLLQAFGQDEGFRFWIKPHPMMPEREYGFVIPSGQLPDHMATVSGPVQKWVSRAACAVATCSTAAMEIALAGVPVIPVGRETDFDINVFSGFPELPPPVRSADELRRHVRGILANWEHKRNEMREWAIRARNDCLSPITDLTIGSFLNLLPREKVMESSDELSLRT